MKVSVVLCTYSEDMYEHFREAAESILSQSYSDVELIVVVDGTDSVYRRVSEDYGNREDVVIHCNNENVGLLKSRNTGAQLATGDVVAFIDDDAVADERWLAELVKSYKQQETLAVGGKMIGEWVDGKPSFLPEEFYWLVGVTHRGFAEGPGEVRNTFGSNISFRAEVFDKLGGFEADIGGRKGDENLQGGETELCARMHKEFGQNVWYNPEAKVAHKVFDYRTNFFWLLDRAFWQGYSKRAMGTFVDDEAGEEGEFLQSILMESTPDRLRRFVSTFKLAPIIQLLVLWVFTLSVGFGYGYGMIRYSA